MSGLLEQLQNTDITDLRRLGLLPQSVQNTLIIMLCVVVIGLSAWWRMLPFEAQMHGEKMREAELRRIFISEQNKAANLSAYKEQLAQMEASFLEMLNQLPDDTEIDSLLAEIATLAQASRLQMRRFRPLASIQHDFYIEHPIELHVTGQFHDLAQFIAALARTSRIVTLTEIDIRRDTTAEGMPERLSAVLLASTYRYAGDEL